MVHVAYFTDPLCPWSWSAEPELRRLQVEFSDQVQITYVMAGMSDEIDPGPKLASTLDAAAQTGMPADPRIWLACPPTSSYPACTAVKAAEEQGREGAYLRRLREGAFLHCERLDAAGALASAARDVGGMDLERFESALRSDSTAESFAADRERAHASCGGEEPHRPSLPAYSVDGGEVIGVEQLRGAVMAAGARPDPLPGVEEALRRFPALADAEVAASCGISRTRAREELWRLAAGSRARPLELAFGELWSAL